MPAGLFDSELEEDTLKLLTEFREAHVTPVLSSGKKPLAEWKVEKEGDTHISLNFEHVIK